MIHPVKSTHFCYIISLRRFGKINHFFPLEYRLVKSTVLISWHFEAKVTTQLSFHLTTTTLFHTSCFMIHTYNHTYTCHRLLIIIFKGDLRPKFQHCFYVRFLLIIWRKSLVQSFVAF